MPDIWICTIHTRKKNKRTHTHTALKIVEEQNEREKLVKTKLKRARAHTQLNVYSGSVQLASRCVLNLVFQEVHLAKHFTCVKSVAIRLQKFHFSTTKCTLI